MTKAELLEAIKHMPDDAEIYVGLDYDDILDPLQIVHCFQGENEIQLSAR